MNIDHVAVKRIRCPRCGAMPGERCVTSGGRPSRPHSARSEPLYAVWRDGYSDGASDLASHALGAAPDAEAWRRFTRRAERIIAHGKATR